MQIESAAKPAIETIGNTLVASRQAQEVQASMVIAKRFPRDQIAAIQKIRTSCKRIGLAKGAIWDYPKGGSKISGPSIRLAEVLAQQWGNINFGVSELSRHGNESVVMSYAWDLETNTRSEKTFTAKHERHRADGTVTQLTDPRDIYEAVANQGARRLRACILAVIPGDVCDVAVAECEKTIKGDIATPLVDRLGDLLVAFENFAVDKGMIEGFLGYKLESASETDFAKLRKVYTSLKEEVKTREDWFQVKMDLPEANPFPDGKKNDSTSNE